MNGGRGNSGIRGAKPCRGIFQADSSYSFLLPCLLSHLSHLSHCPTDGTLGTLGTEGHLGHSLFVFLYDALNRGFAYV